MHPIFIDCFLLAKLPNIIPLSSFVSVLPLFQNYVRLNKWNHQRLLILIDFDRYICWWTVYPRVYNQPSRHNISTNSVLLRFETSKVGSVYFFIKGIYFPRSMLWFIVLLFHYLFLKALPLLLFLNNKETFIVIMCSWCKTKLYPKCC